MLVVNGYMFAQTVRIILKNREQRRQFNFENREKKMDRYGNVMSR